MQVEIIQFNDIPEDGLIDVGEFVPVAGMTSMSPPDGGCGVVGCPCVRGHYLMKLFPRDGDGIVRGFIVEFPDRKTLESTGPEEIAVLVSRAMI